MSKIPNRYAFSMIELIFVIVVMGIIAKYGVEIVARAYNNFIYSKINEELQSTSGSAVSFIAKRMEYRIKKSARAINPTAGTWNFLIGGASDDNATVLEWIAADIDSFRGTTLPYYSGVIDLNASTATALPSPGSSFNNVNTMINNLTNSAVNFNNNVALYFINSTLTLNAWGYNGAITDQNETMHPVNISAISNNTLVPNGGTFSGKTIIEYYKLSWTANAVSLEDYNTTTKMGNLYFYYNYRPWNGETYDNDGTKVLLAEGISAFRFRSAGALLKIQVCAKNDLVEEYALCKEKTVY